MTEDQTERISRRKLEHLELALQGHAVDSRSAGWEDVRLVHDCLPEMALSDVDLHTPFLGRILGAPVWITGMTGGHEQAAVINARLARAAQRFGLAMGLGSQRAALVSDTLMMTYRAAREAAPDAVLVANIGAPQLVPQGENPPLGTADLERLVASVGAQALAIHLNFLQEVVQPEGDDNARGCLAAIRRVTGSLSVPVMAKETGAGISRARAEDLVEAGVQAIDVGGAGGSSMVRMERRRSAGHDGSLASLAETFDSWGIPTAASVLETRSCGVPVIATGGVRTGLDAARAIALGAHMVGVGLPFLQAADRGQEDLDAAVERLLGELRVALFLSGACTATDLREKGAVILGDLGGWARQRGLIP